MSLRVQTDFHILGIRHLAKYFGPTGFDEFVNPVSTFG